MKTLKYILYFTAIFATFAACDGPMDEITEADYPRAFSPADLAVQLGTSGNATATWISVDKAISYVYELSQGDNLVFNNIIKEGETGTTGLTLTGLWGDTQYSLRVKALSYKTGQADSKWTAVTFKTNTEQIFSPIDPNDIEATQVTLRWTAGETATSIVITPGNITYTVTSDDIAAGAATVTGLTGETKYSATLLDGTRVRGTAEFETPVDVGNATLVTANDDLLAMVTAATEGEVFAIMPGEYDLGEFNLTVSIALKGVKPADKPVIKGSFKIDATIASLELNGIIMDGGTTTAQNYPFNTNNNNCNISSITVSNCELNNYGRGLFNINVATAKIGDVKFTNTIISHVNPDGSSGGDGVDIRTGEFKSFIVENCTFNTGFRAFTRVQVNSDMAFRNCTFYKLCTVDNSNNTGLFRISGGTLVVSKCLFVETGVENPTNTSSGNWSKAGNVAATATYTSNYYYNCHNLWVGQYANPTQCSATEANPGFADAANGNFTLSNENLIVNQIGDPRWR